jgi:hypothetical protein
VALSGSEWLQRRKSSSTPANTGITLGATAIFVDISGSRKNFGRPTVLEIAVMHQCDLPKSGCYRHHHISARSGGCTPPFAPFCSAQLFDFGNLSDLAQSGRSFCSPTIFTTLLPWESMSRGEAHPHLAWSLCRANGDWKTCTNSPAGTIIWQSKLREIPTDKSAISQIGNQRLIYALQVS